MPIYSVAEVIREPVTVNTWSGEFWAPGLFKVNAILTFNVGGSFVFAAGHRLLSGKLNRLAYNHVEVRGQPGGRIPVSVQYSMEGDHTCGCGVYCRPEDVPLSFSLQALFGIAVGTIVVAGGGLLYLSHTVGLHLLK